MGKLKTLVAASLLFLGSAMQASADQPSLTLSGIGADRRFTASDLLARSDVTTLTVPSDISYGRPMTYRAVPLLKLLAELPANNRADTLETRAADGFVAQIPLTLLRAADAGGAVPWIAVEPPEQPWPTLPGKAQGAGPFYLVWEHPERSGVSNEQWPYHLASLEFTESPVLRWPQLAADPSLPPDAPAHRGQLVFVTNCLPCHKLNGGGAGEMGPDLGAPMSVTDYLTEGGLRAIVRDPRSVRTWPQSQMPGFSSEKLPNSDLDALVAYLRQSARPKPTAGGTQ